MVERLKEWISWLRKIAPERYLLLALLACAVLLWTWACFALPRPLEVTAYAVGKGDAFLIRAPSGRTVLIDGGSSDVPDVGERLLVPNLMLQHIRRLDAIIITHPDSDHLNGLASVLEAIPVGMLLDPELPGSEGTAYQQLLETAKQRHVPRYRLRAGARINLGNRAQLRILAPGRDLLGGTTSDANNNSVVCRLEYRRASMLFTGDLEMEGEQAVLEAQRDLHADILKVAHHGSRTGTSDAFLDAVRPAWAVISAPGGERGEHPHLETLSRLRARQITILRTDVSGQIRLRTFGNGWHVTTYRRAAKST